MNDERQPAVSVLLPVYNGEPYLRDAIDSVLGQSLREFELVIIDDGSSDGSREMACHYAERDRRVRVLSQPNSGIVAALNLGLARARAEFTARMDADDICCPDRLSIQADFLRSHPRVVMVGGRALLIDAEGRATGEPTTGSRHKSTDLSRFPPRVQTAIHPLIMARTEVLRGIGGYRGNFRYAEDYDLYMRLARCGDIAQIDDVVLLYRIHGGNVSVARLEEQERNAARAELVNLAENRGSSEQEAKHLLSPQLFEAYVGFRILRRRLGLGQRAALKRFGRLSTMCLAQLPSDGMVATRILARLAFHAIHAARSGLLTWA
jgi:glycosyltransferase involved in cell wall biosynthesis